MKRKKFFWLTLMFAILLASNINTFAQEQLIYKPITGNSNSNYNQDEGQIHRATAYYLDSYSKELQKVPIRVKIRDNSKQVIAYYVQSGYGMMSRWESLAYPSSVQQCSPMYSNNNLEKQFMYKAQVWTNVYYFDL